MLDDAHAGCLGFFDGCLSSLGGVSVALHVGMPLTTMATFPVYGHISN